MYDFGWINPVANRVTDYFDDWMPWIEDDAILNSLIDVDVSQWFFDPDADVLHYTFRRSDNRKLPDFLTFNTLIGKVYGQPT